MDGLVKRKRNTERRHASRKPHGAEGSHRKHTTLGCERARMMCRFNPSASKVACKRGAKLLRAPSSTVSNVVQYHVENVDEERDLEFPD